ncbi:MAG TPA: hypothetical protein PLH70_04785 [Bacteroidales bacterium]|nr:hypothetical protein [Bacteroidales bacterium]HOH22040.1 hypothetical protein [Bacteroidales bacterium]HPZ03323.1 hypothetical protein [Bacteroidales bacterium]HQB75098.1 hypothetical protein [Bacteroidales bacterium]
MKKFAFIISCFMAIWGLNAQSVNWGAATKLKTNLFQGNWIANGSYIGSINGTSYYAENVNRAKLVTFEDTRYIFFASDGTKLIRESMPTEIEYDEIGAGVWGEQIYVAHSTTAKKGEKTEVKLDLYDPLNFRKVKTMELFSFQALDKYPFINLAKSENREFTVFVVSGKNPNTGNGTLIIKCFDKEFNEAWTHYYDYNGSGYPEVRNLFLSDAGELVLSITVYENKRKTKLTSLDFVELSASDSKFVSFPLQSQKMELMDLKVGSYGAPHQYLCVYAENESMVGFKVDFNEGGIDPIFTKQAYDGEWKIDQIMDLGDGKYTVAFQNRGLIEIEVRQSNGIIDRTYFYWNRSFRLIGVDSKTNQTTYDQTIGRRYNVKLAQYVYEPYVTVTPYYFVKDGKVHIVYNTDRETNEKECNKHERPDGRIRVSLAMNTKNPATKMITINEDGKYTVKTLFDEKQTNLTFLSRFCHLNDQDELILPIGKKKKMMFGKMSF